MSEPLSDLYLRDCRERLESSEHMDPIEWAERAPSLLGEIDRLRALLGKQSGSSAASVDPAQLAAWQALADRIPPVDDLLAEVGRLTGVVTSHRSSADAEAKVHAMVEKMLEAEFESLAPHTRDNEIEPDAEVLVVARRCDCCSVVIEPGDSAVMFIDEVGRECWACYGACPAPDLWRVEYVDQSAGAGDLAVEGPLAPEDAYALAMSLHSHWWTDRIRLVRCKGPRRG